MVSSAKKTDLHDSPKSCFTAAGCLIVDKKVLLVHHKKLGLWLNPGGHIEPDELPHQAAEREFYEETGIVVEAFYTNYELFTTSKDKKSKPQTQVAHDLETAMENRRSYFAPNPISTNHHWISEQNYLNRLAGSADREAQWQKGCEQHINFLYLVRPLGTIQLRPDMTEVLDARWFTLDQLQSIDAGDQIKQEIELAFWIDAKLQKDL